MTEKSLLTYEGVVLGEELPPSYTEVTRHKVWSVAYAVDDYDPASIPVREGSIGHPLLFAYDLINAYSTKFYTHGGRLHAKQELEILNLPRLGKKVTIHSRYVDRYERRGLKYLVSEAEAVDEDGVVYLRGREHEAMSIPDRTKAAPSEMLTAEVPSITSDILVTHAYKNIPIGAQLTPIRKPITLEQIIVWVGAGRRNSHTDVEFAQSVGLPAPMYQALMSACYISEIATRFFGDGWRRAGKMSLNFIAPAFVGDVLYASATVKEKVPEGRVTRITLDVWCENQRGRRVTVGTASGLVH